jgi:hypothetical protein
LIEDSEDKYEIREDSKKGPAFASIVKLEPVNVYIGEIRGYEKNGRGTLINANLEYTGLWENDERSGRGKQTSLT